MPSTPDPDNQPPPLDRSLIGDELVIHDLRNPLTAILGNLQLMEATTGDEKTRRRLEACLASVDELTHMLSDLQQLVRRGRDAGEPTETIDAAGLLDAVHADYKARGGSTDRVEVIKPDDALAVHGPARLMRRALLAFVDAAGRLGRTEPIRVSVEPTGRGSVAWVVGYTGRSLPEDLAERLWAEDSTVAQEEHGLRLDRARALMLAPLIAERCGGEVRYESTEAGGRFVLELPAADSDGRERDA